MGADEFVPAWELDDLVHASVNRPAHRAVPFRPPGLAHKWAPASVIPACRGSQRNGRACRVQERASADGNSNNVSAPTPYA